MAIRADLLPPRYRGAEHVARGGMGDVYRATDTVLGRPVAVKILADRYADDEGVRERFTREAQAAARLSGDPNTVTIFDVGEWEGRAYIVMEFLEGGTLEDRVKAQGAQDPADVLRWLYQAATALDAAHRAGIVHRDVKPGNLLLDGDGQVHVADFGVASAVGLESMTMTGTVLGTAGYLAPEQARGERATPASDRYALAVVAFELLTGERPFAAETPTAEAVAHVHGDIPSISDRADVPRELDPVFSRALAKDPAQRYTSSVDFVNALREALAAAAGTTGQLAAVREERHVVTPPAYAPPRSGRPNPLVWAGLALLALLALGGGLALAGVLGGGDDEASDSRTLVRTETQIVTTEGERETVRQRVTVTAPAPAPPPPPPATTAPTTPTTTAPTSGGNGVQLTDQATALLREGRWAEAESVARRAVAALNGSGELYEAYANYNLGRALVEQGRCDEALPHLDTSERIQGSRREIREARARCA